MLSRMAGTSYPLNKRYIIWLPVSQCPKACNGCEFEDEFDDEDDSLPCREVYPGISRPARA
jgi:hypothetical protein